MTTLFTLLVIAAMIGVGVLLIQLANARHTALSAAAKPHHRRLRRHGATAAHTLRRP
ncbi:NADPH:quinone reductase-like Zn-dependent oxidoreductase [Streptacidiphilus sp. MAP12-20]|uniref:hypothetical protein n=1 Tax=Streptacidiphilus sp. MAP12-20 TaxID=3156299 RepID=UPI0035124C5A